MELENGRIDSYIYHLGLLEQPPLPPLLPSPCYSIWLKLLLTISFQISSSSTCLPSLTDSPSTTLSFPEFLFSLALPTILLGRLACKMLFKPTLFGVLLMALFHILALPLFCLALLPLNRKNKRSWIIVSLAF